MPGELEAFQDADQIHPATHRRGLKRPGQMRAADDL
jgi:hypothetical protein